MEDIRKTFDRFREAIKINEADIKKKSENAHAYSSQDDIFINSLQATKTQFGADYNGFKTPMLYYKDDGDVTLSGNIPELNNAKFQFRYKEPSGQGCFVWLDEFILSDENLKRLQKMLGVYKNWKQELSTGEDIRPMSLRND